MFAMRRTLLSTLLVVLVLSGVALLNAITFGEPDGNAHPYVGTLIFESASGGLYSCSGTLLSPTVMLTAGHCTEENGVPNSHTWVKFAPAISFAGIEEYDSIQEYLDDATNGWTSGTAYPHPQYDDYAQFPATFDVGVIILDEPVVVNTYAVLPQEGFLNTLTTHRTKGENIFTAVGYGLQGVIRPFYSNVYGRYQGTVRLIELNSKFNGGMSAKFTNNPGTGGGSCFGDSGGPIFLANTNMVVAVVSWGITPCIGVDYQFRVDTEVAQGFLESFIP